jgi:uncharacterized membrane protein YraQ (UPF0718 family)
MKRLKQKIDNLSSSLKFLSFTILVYLFLFIFNFNFFITSLNKFVDLSIKILPSILGAFVLIFIFNYALSDEKIKKYLIGDINWKKYILSVGLGILSSGPIYVWFPFLSDLKQRGFKNSLITIFLYNRAIKLQFIPLLIYYFSLQFVMLITTLMIIFSIINGLLMDKIIKNKKVVNN